jgi:predicted HTH transcriptional regulator
MREQGLLVGRHSGRDEVTKGAILLFGKTTRAIIPQAVISVTEAGKRREIYDGNLITQHRLLLEKRVLSANMRRISLIDGMKALGCRSLVL